MNWRVLTAIGSFIASMLHPVAKAVEAIEIPAPPLGTEASEVINRLLKTNKSVRLGCGIYTLRKSILMPSDSRLSGKGDCTVLRAEPSLAESQQWREIDGASQDARMMVTNDDFNRGNSNIQISQLTLDATLYSKKGHIAGFYNVSGAKISHVRFTGGANPKTLDGVAFVNSSNYIVKNNICEQVKTACFDNWGGDSGFVISDNIAIGKPNFSSYGVLVNGANTNDTPNTSYDGTISDNTITWVSQCIFVGGLKLRNGSHGAIENIFIRNNDIENVDYHGIRVADGRLVSVFENTVASAGRNCLVIGSEGGGGTTEDVIVRGNRFEDCADVDPNSDAVNIYSGASKITYQYNTIRGERQRYSIRIDETVSNSRIDPEGSQAGRLGKLRNSGKNVNN